jgi:multidrug efflux pump subunit AcrA (membrane-fusion protein)
VTAEEVLTVPLRAVQTRSNGDSYLRVVSGSKTEEVTVRVGRSGSGFVELTDTTGIEAGNKVLLG